MIDIFKSQLNGAITFKSEKLIYPKKTIFISDCDHNKMEIDELNYNLIDKKFPTESLISYIDSNKNKNSFLKIKEIVSNNDL